ncbi:MAG: hypothetical protein ACC726_13560 [Chloroflexota bacterium]
MNLPTRTARWATLLASFALVVSAAGVQAESDAAEAPAMSVEVSGLASGDVVAANQIDLTVVPVGYELSPDGVGKPPVDGQGHYHVVLDGALVNAFFTPDASFSLQNVAAGPHTVMVVPAMNSHMPVMEGAAAIEFDYQPDSPLPLIEAASEAAAGDAAVAIVSPAAGDTVSGNFDLVVEATDFELSTDLLGKGNIDGIGHWHAFVDEVGQPALLGMAGGDSLAVSTAGLEPGPHSFFAVLVDNLHVPFDPPIVTEVEVEVAAAE